MHLLEIKNLKKDVDELKLKPNKKVLWSGNNSNAETLTLNDNIENYDLILCLTLSHKSSVLEFCPQLKGRVFTLKEYCFPDDEYKIPSIRPA